MKFPLSRFRRVTSSGSLIPEIDGLRFLAIFFVFVFHLAGDVLRHSQASDVARLLSSPLVKVTQSLNVGVQMFFVISGFILGLPFASHRLLASQPVPLGKYFLRRITRLEPPYLLALLLLFALKVLAGRGTARELLPHLMASMGYLHLALYGGPSTINFVAWSLEIEVQFYLLAPILAGVFAVRRPMLRRGAIIAACLILESLRHFLSAELLSNTILGYGQYFLAGFLLVDLYLSGDIKARSWRWDCFSTAGWVLFFFVLLGWPSAFGWIAPLLLVAIYYGSLKSILLRRLLSNAWVSTIGGMCYTIYLTHNYQIAAMGLWTHRFLREESFLVRLLTQFAIIAPTVLLVSGIYFLAIEKPCMQADWPQRAWLWIKNRIVAHRIRRACPHFVGAGRV